MQGKINPFDSEMTNLLRCFLDLSDAYVDLIRALEDQSLNRSQRWYWIDHEIKAYLKTVRAEDGHRFGGR